MNYPCNGSGKRVAAPSSTAFPEVECSEEGCFHYAAPVKKYGEYYVRSHRKVATDPYPEDS